jgi:sarcosine oxidase subunit delta
MQISCPFCGKRDETEFRCGGQSYIERPGPARAITDAIWADYLFNRDNPKGWHYERWCHAAGCGQWFNMLRHTVSHEIAATYKIGAAKPDLPEPALEKGPHS